MNFFWAGGLACGLSNDSDGALSSLEPTEQVETVVQTKAKLNVDEPPPERNSAKTKAMIDKIVAGEVAFTQFKACQLLDTNEGNAPKGQFFYAWNESSTVGLVLSIHQFSLTTMGVGHSQTFSVSERDAFIMIEVGEGIDTNFCVPDIQQIPISTVLESQTGSVQVTRTKDGVEANMGRVLFRDQYTNQEIYFKGISIPSQTLISL